jgi:hypothetical protein
MSQTTTRRVALGAALAALGIGSFATTASAQVKRHDNDRDGIPDARDRDDDNDGRPDRIDRDANGDGRPDNRPAPRRDTDRDGIPNRVDRDNDNDGIRDRNDPNPNRRNAWRTRWAPIRYDIRHYDDIDQYDLGMYGYSGDDYFTRDYMFADRNRDGVVSLREREAFWIDMSVSGMFGPMTRVQARNMTWLASSFDRDGNGRLTRDEARRLTRYVKARRAFMAFDRDRDGRLFRNETRGWFRNQFNVLDINNDRKVTHAELRRHFVAPRRSWWGYR